MCIIPAFGLPVVPELKGSSRGESGDMSEGDNIPPCPLLHTPAKVTTPCSAPCSSPSTSMTLDSRSLSWELRAARTLA